MAFDEKRYEESRKIIESDMDEIKIRLDLYDILEINKTPADYAHNIDLVGVTLAGKTINIQHKYISGEYNGKKKDLCLEQYFEKFRTSCYFDEESLGFGKELKTKHGREIGKDKYRALKVGKADFLAYHFHEILYIFDYRLLNRAYLHHRDLFHDCYNSEDEPICFVKYDDMEKLKEAYEDVFNLEYGGLSNNNQTICIY